MTDEIPDSAIAQRKLDHLRLCAEEEVEARVKTTLLDDVDLIHHALPELSVDEVDLSTELLGKTLRVPLLITGMTGGVGQATELNRSLAAAAERYGLGFGFGSQRPMLELSELPPGYSVRDVAPNALVLGNLGAVQAAATPTAQVAALLERVGADALAIHLNVGQELIQPEGDRDFRGCVAGIRRLVEELPVPVIVKETGCGIGPGALARLVETGVEWVDVSGSGGTTWVGVESKRSDNPRARMGQTLWDWGIPTAAATLCAVKAGFGTVASGGLRSGFDAARALALGARVAGMALPLRAWYEGGDDALDATVARIVEEIRTVMLLTGSRNLAALHAAPRIIGPRLSRWMEQLG